MRDVYKRQVHNPLVQFVYLCPCVLAYYFYSRICPLSLAALFCEKAAQKSSQAFLSCKYKNNVFSKDVYKRQVPHFGLSALHHLAGGLDVVGNTLLHQILHDKGLEQLQSHFLRQTALILSLIHI